MRRLGRRLALPFACAGLAMMVVPAPARATSVTYSTTGSFAAGTDASAVGNVLTITDPANSSQSVTLTFTPRTSVSVASFVVGALGEFHVDASTVAGSPLDIPTTPAVSTFSLRVDQTAPTGGTGSVAATIGGTVSFNSGSVEFHYTNTSVTIGPIVYHMTDLGGSGVPDNAQLLEPNGGGASGTTVVHALITEPSSSSPSPAAVSPEPSTLLLAGFFGLVSIAGLAWRRRRVAA